MTNPVEQIETLTEKLGYTWQWSPLKVYIFSGPMPGAKRLKTFPCEIDNPEEALNRTVTWLERIAG